MTPRIWTKHTLTLKVWERKRLCTRCCIPVFHGIPVFHFQGKFNMVSKMIPLQVFFIFPQDPWPDEFVYYMYCLCCCTSSVVTWFSWSYALTDRCKHITHQNKSKVRVKERKASFLSAIKYTSTKHHSAHRGSPPHPPPLQTLIAIVQNNWNASNN